MRFKTDLKIKIKGLNCRVNTKKINKEKKIRKYKRNFLRMITFHVTIKENAQKKIVFVTKKGGSVKNFVVVPKHVLLNSLGVYVSLNAGLLASAP